MSSATGGKGDASPGAGDTDKLDVPLTDFPLIKLAIRSCNSLFRASSSETCSRESSLSSPPTEYSDPVGVVSLLDGLVGVVSLLAGLDTPNFVEGDPAIRRFEGDTGEGGGGISVLRADLGVPGPPPAVPPNPNPPDGRALIPPGAGILRGARGALGVTKGEPVAPFLAGLPTAGEFVISPAAVFACCNCCAVIPAYLLALDPAVKCGVSAVVE